MARATYFAVRLLIRTAVVWFVDALSLWLAAWILAGGITFSAVDGTPRWVVAIAAAMIVAIVNMFIRPVILLFARPLGWMVLFGVGYLVDALALWLTAWLLPGFEVTFIGGLVGAMVVAVFNTVILGMLDMNEEGSFYRNRIERRAQRGTFSSTDESGTALMMVEIDGLSYWHITKAIEEGRMPTLKQMMDEDGYVLSRVDCGLPSMTSACQAGIMFGDNYDIPAYRWYDKSKQKLYVSADDAAELNARYAKGEGLMRGGSSIDNMLDGDAEKSMFTMSNLKGGSAEEKKLRADDVNLLLLDPYFLTRTLVIFFWEVGRELWQGWRQKRNNVWPRLNRTAHFYPFVRAATCTLLRDLSANIAIMDMMRGASSIYMLYLGYDEVAHHSGPWTKDAFGDLHRLDGTLASLREVVKSKAPRHYDLIILSDHGQSFGATFKQRYGMDIKDLIEQLMPEGTSVSQAIGGDTGAVGLSGLAGELTNASESEGGTPFDKVMAKQGQKLADHAARRSDTVVTGDPASVMAYGSGNAAQVYFDLYPRKIQLSELEQAYPGLVNSLVAHEGIGLVCGYQDDETVLAVSKEGTRNLHTGEVTGEDPLLPYAPGSGYGAASLDDRIWQMKRVMEFPSAGDLWVMSTIYPDGTVAALEELIGSHGGAGGEQTDAFIFHPGHMEVPETRSSLDVYHILNNHRGTPVVTPPEPEEPAVPEWAFSTLVAGIARVGAWVPNALRAAFMDRDTYARVADDVYSTGPALLLVLATALLGTVLRVGSLDLLHYAASIGLWFLSTFALYLAGRFLAKPGKFTDTFRAVGFAQTTYFLAPLALIPLVGPLIRALLPVLLFLNTWIGAATAQKMRGWRTLALPVVAWAVLAVGYILISMLLTGTEFALEGILASLGISTPQ